MGDENKFVEYGNGFGVKQDRPKKETVEEISKWLINDARDTIGRNKVVEIRAKVILDVPGMVYYAWYYCECLIEKKDIGAIAPELLNTTGYYFCGTFRT